MEWPVVRALCTLEMEINMKENLLITYPMELENITLIIIMITAITSKAWIKPPVT